MDTSGSNSAGVILAVLRRSPSNPISRVQRHRGVPRAAPGVHVRVCGMITLRQTCGFAPPPFQTGCLGAVAPQKP
jgi:hypothetical protein